MCVTRPAMGVVACNGVPWCVSPMLGLACADCEAQKAVDECYKNPSEWTRRSILSTAGMGKFSTDRTYVTLLCPTLLGCAPMLWWLCDASRPHPTAPATASPSTLATSGGSSQPGVPSLVPPTLATCPSGVCAASPTSIPTRSSRPTAVRLPLLLRRQPQVPVQVRVVPGLGASRKGQVSSRSLPLLDVFLGKPSFGSG